MADEAPDKLIDRIAEAVVRKIDVPALLQHEAVVPVLPSSLRRA